MDEFSRPRTRTATNGQYDPASRMDLEPGRLRLFRGAVVIMEVKVSFARLNRGSKGRFAEFDGGKRFSGGEGHGSVDRSPAGPEGSQEDREHHGAADGGNQPDRAPVDHAGRRGVGRDRADQGVAQGVSGAVHPEAEQALRAGARVPGADAVDVDGRGDSGAGEADPVNGDGRDKGRERRAEGPAEV